MYYLLLENHLPLEFFVFETATFYRVKFSSISSEIVFNLIKSFNGFETECDIIEYAYINSFATLNSICVMFFLSKL